MTRVGFLFPEQKQILPPFALPPPKNLVLPSILPSAGSIQGRGEGGLGEKAIPSFSAPPPSCIPPPPSHKRPPSTSTLYLSASRDLSLRPTPSASSAPCPSAFLCPPGLASAPTSCTEAVSTEFIKT